MPAQTATAKPKARAKKQSHSAEDVLLLELKEIYSAEKQLSRALPQITKAIQSEDVRRFFEQRQEQGERLLQDLDQAFDTLQTSPGRAKNVVAEALIADAREHIQDIEKGPGLDAVLIGAVQKTEHYCVAAWGVARTLAEALEEEEIAASMQRAIDEGKMLDEELSQVAEEQVMTALVEIDDMDDNA
jgi:ferritin-like metal-binding protein YciE